MAEPLVSLILVSGDAERAAGTTLRSVLAQTDPRWELIAVGEAPASADARVRRLPAVPAESFAAAYGRALPSCRGQYVGALAAGGVLEPRRLARQLARFAADPRLGVLATYVAEPDGAGDAAAWFNRERDLDRAASWGMRNVLCRPSVLVRRSLHDQIGPPDPELRVVADHELWLRALAQGARFGVLPEPLVRPGRPEAAPEVEGERRFLELAYLFATSLAPLLARAGEPELLLPALSFLTGRFLDDCPAAARGAAVRELLGFPLHRRGFPAFAAAFARGCGRHWPAVAAAVANRPPAPPPRSLPPRRGRKLGMVDAHFPWLLSGFTICEFNHYFERLEAEAHSTSRDFDRLWGAYGVRYPQHQARVRRLDPERLADCSLLYFLFLNNAFDHLPLIERLGIPFVFTLYPGGGFQLDEPISDFKLRRVARSPLLRKIVVTQRVTLDYLLAKRVCAPSMLELIWGGAFPADYYSAQARPKLRYPADKPTFDVCFVARKTMPRGSNKGYDTFVAAAQRLARASPDFRFHVVGEFAAADVPLGELGPRITFHGPRTTPFFPGFHAGMDVILSPNVPFRLLPGAFDGFPTGCCTEASLCGVAVVCSDELDENRQYAPGEEIEIVGPDPADCADRVLALARDPERLDRLARAGQARSRALFSRENQLDRRVALLEEHL